MATFSGYLQSVELITHCESRIIQSATELARLYMTDIKSRIVGDILHHGWKNKPNHCQFASSLACRINL